jgi:hypothetical protein
MIRCLLTHLQDDNFATRQALHKDVSRLRDGKSLPGFQDMVVEITGLGQPDGAGGAQDAHPRLPGFKLEQLQPLQLNLRTNACDNHLYLHSAAENIFPPDIHDLPPKFSSAGAGLNLTIGRSVYHHP